MNTGRWTQEEEKLYDKYRIIYNNNWKIISKYIITRNSSQIRSHHQKELKKKLEYALILIELSRQ